MAEETWALQRTQWGKQSAYLTGVAATVRLVALTVDDEPAPTFHEYGPQGELAMTGEAAGITSATHKIGGRSDYNEFTWLLAGALGNVAPSHPGGATTAWQRIWTPVADDVWSPMPISQERGADTRGRYYQDLIIKGVDFTFGPDKYDPSGDAFSAAVEINHALTASLAGLAAVPILGPETKVYLDSTNQFSSTPTQVTRYFEGKWGLADIYAPDYPGGVNANNGPGVYVQKKPKMTGQLTCEANSTLEGLILGLQQSDAIGYLRIESIGPQIETGHTYLFRIDSAIKFTKQSAYKAIGQSSGLLGNDYPFTIVKDPAWNAVNSAGQFCQITLVNIVPAL